MQVQNVSPILRFFVRGDAKIGNTLSKSGYLKSLKAIFYDFPERNKLKKAAFLINNSLGKQITNRNSKKFVIF